MILIKRILALMPMPLFLAFAVFSPSSVCGGFMGEMTWMWALMALAHSLPWVQWLEQVYLTHKHRSV